MVKIQTYQRMILQDETQSLNLLGDWGLVDIKGELEPLLL